VAAKRELPDKPSAKTATKINSLNILSMIFHLSLFI